MRGRGLGSAVAGGLPLPVARQGRYVTGCPPLSFWLFSSAGNHLIAKTINKIEGMIL